MTAVDLNLKEVKTMERKQRFTGRTFRFRKELAKHYVDTKYFIFLGQKDNGEWIEIDRNLYIDLRAMTNEDKVYMQFTGNNVLEYEIKTDARRERMFTTIAKHWYGVEV